MPARSPSRRPRRLSLRVEELEDRVTPAYTATLFSNQSIWTGDSLSVGDTVIFGASGGLLTHNRFLQGDPGFESEFDFDSTNEGDQTLAASLSSLVSLTTGDGPDSVQMGTPFSFSAPASALFASFSIILNANGQEVVVDDNVVTGTTYSVSFIADTTSIRATGIVVDVFTFGGVGGVNADRIALSTGSGADAVLVSAADANGPIVLDTRAGNDIILFNDFSTLRGGTIDGGADTDTIQYSSSPTATAVAVNLGLGVSGLTAALDGGQENPGTGSSATGVATLGNYDVLTKTFDLSLTVANLSPAAVTGLHLHRGGVGVNGPILLDLLSLGTLVPSGTGFTLTLTGLSVNSFLLGGVLSEAAFLGGQTYLNIHTAAAPAGLIRGQVFSTGNVAVSSGTASRTGGVTNIENVTGSTGDDSLIGSFAANTLNGIFGNDTLLGGPGADTLIGFDGDDVMIWSNGDGSDVMDGGTGNDTVAVNGNLTANDVFTIGANGTRVAFNRTSPGPFSLDIGTTETLRVNGIGGNDSFTVNSLVGVANLSSVYLFGLAGNDTFTVTPFAGTITAGGGLGSDILLVAIAGTTNPFITIAADPAGGRIGGYTFGNHGPVNFTQTEFPAPSANYLSVGKTDGLTTVTAGTTITYLVTVMNNTALGVNGILVTDQLPAALLGATWTASFTPGSSGATAGSGSISQSVNLAAGGSVTYTITGTIGIETVGTLTNIASAAAPAGLTDTDTGDDSATDSTTVTAPVVPPPPVPPPPVPPTVTRTDLYAVATGPGVPVVVDVFNADGSRRFSLVPFGGFSGGATVATGDLTGDGVDDIAVGARAGGTPHVKLFDGRTGEEVWSFLAYFDQFPGGVSVAVGDVNGDGYADVVTGAGPGGGPHLKVFDGRTGAEVLSMYAYFRGFRGGVSVATGDVDGDGRAELITGALTGGGPHVKVFDGRTGAERLGFYAFEEGFFGGLNVAAADLNGDGRDELVVGQASRGGVVSTFDGLTAARSTDLEPFPGFTGGVNVAAADLFHDGTDEVLLGAGAGGGPFVRILSFSPPEDLAGFYAFDPAFLGGVQVG